MEKPNYVTLYAPCSGPILPLSQVPDPVFSQKITGDGIAVDPIDDIILAPIDGTISLIHRCHHALSITTEDDREFLIHVGIDTVKLEGQGFAPLVQVGQKVSRGTPLLKLDLPLLLEKAKSLITVLLATQTDLLRSVDPLQSYYSQTQNDQPLLKLSYQKKSEKNPAQEPGKTFDHTLNIASPIGLHARPCSLLLQLARSHPQTKITLCHQQKRAPLNSLTQLMSLEVGPHAEVKIQVEGAQREAQQALKELTELLTDPNRLEPGGSTSVPTSSPRLQSQGPFCVSPGLARGTLLLLQEGPESFPEPQSSSQEWERYQDALKLLEKELQRKANELQEAEAAIFGAHIDLLRDPQWQEAIHHKIHQEKVSAGRAISDASKTLQQELRALESPLLAGRAVDIADLAQQLLALAYPELQKELDFPQGSILLTTTPTPSLISKLVEKGAAALLAIEGGATDHSAILARSFELPTLFGVSPQLLEKVGQEVILRAGQVELIFDPSEKELESYEAQLQKEQTTKAFLREQSRKPALTTDHQLIEVGANLQSPQGYQHLKSSGADGVGLLRSEFFYFERDQPPTTAEIIDDLRPLFQELPSMAKVVIRTLDIGGDKPLEYLTSLSESNPFLGVRGIRLSFQHPQLFETQLLALCELHQEFELSIMLPMVSKVKELEQVQALLQEICKENQWEPPTLGIMIETPSAALLAPQLASRCDFFSLGTNDLTQYTLAMDRTSPLLASELDTLEPSLLKLIEWTTKASHQNRIWTGVCGSSAGDPLAIPILIGLGVEELSVNLPQIGPTKALIQQLSLEHCQDLAQKALVLDSAQAVRSMVQEYFRKEEITTYE